MRHSFRERLGKMFLTFSALLWAICDNSTTDAPPPSPLEGAKIDVENEVAKLGTVDTTGLLGQTISREKYCAMTDDDAPVASPTDEARFILQGHLGQFLETPQGKKLASSQKQCLQDIINDMVEFPTDYGVYMCPEDGKTVIDELYINKMLRRHGYMVYGVRHRLEEYNQGVDLCEE